MIALFKVLPPPGKPSGVTCIRELEVSRSVKSLAIGADMVTDWFHVQPLD